MTAANTVSNSADETDQFIEGMIAGFAEKMRDSGFCVFISVGTKDNTYSDFYGTSNDISDFIKVASTIQLLVNIREQIDGK